jgi:hypothetical protein
MWDLPEVRIDVGSDGGVAQVRRLTGQSLDSDHNNYHRPHGGVA